MKRIFRAESGKSITASEDKSSQYSDMNVAQVSIDIRHNGDYSLDDISNLLEDAGYDVLGIDSQDVTDVYM